MDTNKTIKDSAAEEQCRHLFEQLRWDGSPTCPHCGSTKTFRLIARAQSKHPVRSGVLKCANCRKQFSVTVGTIFERSHISLCNWMEAIKAYCASVEGISSYRLHQLLGITYKSARFIEARLRYALSQQQPIRQFPEAA